jgi:hypothetical protein
MLAGKKNIINIIKNIKNLNEKKDGRRALKGSKNLWLNENIIAPIWTAIFAAEDAAKKGAVSTRQLCYLTLMLNASRLRPVSLRPTLSSGLPFTSIEIKCEKY